MAINLLPALVAGRDVSWNIFYGWSEMMQANLSIRRWSQNQPLVMFLLSTLSKDFWFTILIISSSHLSYTTCKHFLALHVLSPQPIEAPHKNRISPHPLNMTQRENLLPPSTYVGISVRSTCNVNKNVITHDKQKCLMSILYVSFILLRI